MKKGQNLNALPAGSFKTVDPIRKLSDVKKIIHLLKDRPRDKLLFIMGINNGLRTGDLLKLKVKDLKDLDVGGIKKIKESKTGKTNVLVINKTTHKALQDYFSAVRPTDDDFIFKSKKGDNRAITTAAVNNMIKRWTASCKIKGNFGAHSLRKTWGYIQRKHFGVDFSIICKRFNHSSPAVTMVYLGIEDKEVNDVLKNNAIG